MTEERVPLSSDKKDGHSLMRAPCKETIEISKRKSDFRGFDEEDLEFDHVYFPRDDVLVTVSTVNVLTIDYGHCRVHFDADIHIFPLFDDNLFAYEPSSNMFWLVPVSSLPKESHRYMEFFPDLRDLKDAIPIEFPRPDSFIKALFVKTGDLISGRFFGIVDHTPGFYIYLYKWDAEARTIKTVCNMIETTADSV